MSGNAARSLMDAALRATSQTDFGSDDDFEDLMRSTRRSFRPRLTFGRKRNDTIKKSVILLRRSNADFCPVAAELTFLTSRGLGKKQGCLKRYWKKIELETYLYSLYAELPLELVGFKYGKTDRSKKIEIIHDFEEVNKLLDEVKQGSIFLIPNRDLPLPTGSSVSQSNHGIRTNINRGTRTNVTQSQPSTTIFASQSNNTVSTNENHIILDAVERIPVLPLNIPLLPMAEDNDIINPSPDMPAGLDMDNDLPLSFIFDLPKMPENADCINIYINRSDIFTEVLELYKDSNIVNKKVCVEFLYESGEDMGGLTKEFFNLFWQKAQEEYFIGEDCCVPFIPLHRVRKEKEMFIILGRVLAHMLVLIGNLPPKISRIVYSLLINLEVDNEILLEDFLLFVAPLERLVVKKALSNFNSLTDKEKDILINTFISYGFYELPREKDCKDQIVAIAQETMIEKSKVFVEKIKEGIPEMQFENFWKKWDCNIISCILLNQRPTKRKILDSLLTSLELNNDEIKVFHYLQNFIQSLDTDNLLKFLFFITGSFLCPTTINVSFNKLVGPLRRPICHTCSNTIELSCYYTSYQEFKREINMYLNDENSFLYSQI